MTARGVTKLLEEVGKALNALPGVFSTPQWGGRAYKLPGPNGNRNKPKLLAHVYLTRDEKAVGISFKLDKQRAREAIEQFDWLGPHSFRTLAPSGWLDARITSTKQLPALKKLFAESRALHPAATDESGASAPSGGGKNEIAGQIDRVMSIAKSTGWSPPQTDDFDPPSPQERRGKRKPRQ